MDELKPCPTPWCKGRVVQFTSGGYYEVPQPCPPRCDICGVSARSVEEWNTRPTPAAPDDLVETAGLAFAQQFYGPGFDPHLNPEAYDMACEATRAIIPIVQAARDAQEAEIASIYYEQGKAAAKQEIVEWLRDKDRRFATFLPIASTYADAIEKGAIDD